MEMMMMIKVNYCTLDPVRARVLACLMQNDELIN
jgi:hypothetical protein